MGSGPDEQRGEPGAFRIERGTWSQRFHRLPGLGRCDERAFLAGAAGSSGV